MYQAPIRATAVIAPKKENKLLTIDQLIEELRSVKDSLVKELDRADLKTQLVDNAIQRFNNAFLQIEKRLKNVDTKLSKTDELAGRVQQLIDDTKMISKGDQGVRGFRGFPGRNGEDAVIDIESLIQRIVALIPTPKDGEDGDDAVIDEVSIVKKAAKLVLANLPEPKPVKIPKIDHEKLAGIVAQQIDEGKIKLKSKHIEDYEDPTKSAEVVLRRFIARGALHGAGDTVKAGTNITLTRNSDGTTTISSSGGSSSSPILTATGSINDSNTVFTFATTPAFVVVNGATYIHGGGVTIAGTTVTLDNPVGTGGSIYGIEDLSVAVSNSSLLVTTAQFDKVDDTPANVTGLTTSVVAGSTYRFEAVLFVQGDATGGLRFNIGGSAVASSVIYQIILISNASLNNTIVEVQGDLVSSSVADSVSAGICRMTGTIAVGTSGTLEVDFAQKTPNGTSSVLRGSYFDIQRVV